MAHQLLGDALRAADPAARRRTWSVLPLSIVAHVVAAGLFLIIPLAADVEFPTLVRPTHAYVQAMAAPLAPAPAPPRGRAAVSRSAAAPISAPSSIQKEDPAVIVDGAAGPALPGPPGLPTGVEGVPTIGDGARIHVAPPPPAAKTIHRIGGTIRQPRKVVDVPPVYPPLAIAARKEGVVILEAMLDEQGNVVRLKVLRSEPLLDDAALQAVRRWRYTPTLLNGVPVPVLMTVTVHFSLR